MLFCLDIPVNLLLQQEVRRHPQHARFYAIELFNKLLHISPTKLLVLPLCMYVNEEPFSCP